jgi:hypothetical protein
VTLYENEVSSDSCHINLFRNQNIEQKEPEKKTPSTAANATRRSAKVAFKNEK